MSNTITYRGVVTKVRPGILEVEIHDETACDACLSQASCCMSGTQKKQIDVPFTDGDYHPGDEVTVAGKTSMGLQAVLVAFVVPVFLIATVLQIFSPIGERQAALIGLSALVIYYTGIYLLRNKFKRTFTFTLQ
jgi:sigma-E factor negative regulatory protein RseC